MRTLEIFCEIDPQDMIWHLLVRARLMHRYKIDFALHHSQKVSTHQFPQLRSCNCKMENKHAQANTHTKIGIQQCAFRKTSEGKMGGSGGRERREETALSIKVSTSLTADLEKSSAQSLMHRQIEIACNRSRKSA